MNWKPYEPTLHRLMGFGAGLLNLRLLLTLREERQLPPATERLPVLQFEDPHVFDPTIFPWGGGKHEYWAAERVLDTLNDLKHYDQGATAAWFVVLAAGILIGWIIP